MPLMYRGESEMSLCVSGHLWGMAGAEFGDGLWLCHIGLDSVR